MKSSLLYKWCKIYKTERPIAYVTAKAQKRISSHNWLIFPIYLGLSKEANLTFCPLVSFFKFALGILGDLKPARQNTTKNNNFFSRSILVAYSLLNIENKPKGNPLESIFYNLKTDWDFFFLSSFLNWSWNMLRPSSDSSGLLLELTILFALLFSDIEGGNKPLMG